LGNRHNTQHETFPNTGKKIPAKSNVRTSSAHRSMSRGSIQPTSSHYKEVLSQKSSHPDEHPSFPSNAVTNSYQIKSIEAKDEDLNSRSSNRVLEEGTLSKNASCSRKDLESVSREHASTKLRAEREHCKRNGFQRALGTKRKKNPKKTLFE